MDEMRPPKALRFGVMKGRAQVAPDFDGPLPADLQEAFERALSAGEAVHEPVVLTKVQAALQAAGLPEPGAYEEHLAGESVVLFVDIDGVAHPQGASRVDDQGKLAGEGLFCWWSQLQAVLDEFPDVRVVLHSSWVRMWGPLPYLKPLLPPGLAARVTDTTSMDEWRRGLAVQAWVDAHASELGAYVVLDDRGDSFGSHVPLVLCDPQRGLSDPAKVEELRAALGAAKKAAWLAQNSAALESSNRFVEAHGLPLALCDPQRGLSDPAKVEERRAALSAAKQKDQALVQGALQGLEDLAAGRVLDEAELEQLLKKQAAKG